MYWQKETPKTITTTKNVLQFYPNAGKLAVARPHWTDDEGKQRQGKTVTIDIESLILSEDKDTAKAVFTEILEMLGEEGG